jgi:hypothetical protein
LFHGFFSGHRKHVSDFGQKGKVAHGISRLRPRPS